MGFNVMVDIQALPSITFSHQNKLGIAQILKLLSVRSFRTNNMISIWEQISYNGNLSCKLIFNIENSS